MLNTNFLFLMNKYIQGAVIKEGQVIGYLDQFGNELPIKVCFFIVFMLILCPKIV